MTGLNIPIGLVRQGRIWLALGLALIATTALAQFEPSNVSTAKICDDRLSLKWAPANDASGYRVSLVTGDGEQVVCDGTEPSCTVRKLKPGKTYSYFVDKKTDDGLLLSNEPIRVTGPDMGHCVAGAAVATPAPRPPVDTCSSLPSGISVRSHAPFSTQCQQVSGAGVGNAQLIAQGILDAVDVWGNVSSAIQVCFQQPGRLYFLDAATSPRALSELPAERIEGMTCGRITRAGTVALLPGGGTSSPIVVEASDSPPEAAAAGPASTTSCQLETTGYLSLRVGPSINYARILSMPRGDRLTARARIGDWFMVSYEGQQGWASGEYLAASPGCDDLGEAGALILLPPTAPSAPQAEAAMTESETEATEMTAAGVQLLTHCDLRSGDIINLRLGPGLDFGVLAEIPYKTFLIPSERSGDWFKVEYLAQTGWVHIDFVFRNGACG